MAKKGRGSNKKPSREKYKTEGVLEKHKVHHLMKFNGMTERAARELWRATRRRNRVMPARTLTK